MGIFNKENDYDCPYAIGSQSSPSSWEAYVRSPRVSDANVDPELLGPQESPLKAKYCNTSQAMKLPGIQSFLKTSPVPDLSQVDYKKTGKKTARYNYWTEEEDRLVLALRHKKCTWKEIALSLQAQLNVSHTWQAIQMRYLRVLKKLSFEEPEVPYPKEDQQEPPSKSFTKLVANLSHIESAIVRDWDHRWKRISAMSGLDIEECDITEELLAKSKVLQQYALRD